MKTFFPSTCLIMLLSFPVQLFSQGEEETYFPMEVGNEWHYISNLFPESLEINDTVIINSKKYYNFIPGDIEYFLLMRYTENKVYAVVPEDSSEVMVFNFEADTGDVWLLPEIFNCSFGQEITLVSKNETITTGSGTYSGCYHFRHETPCADAGYTDSWFAKGVGKVRYKAVFFSGSGIFELDEYVITGLNETPFETKSFNLLQNYPNPFNPVTNISFRIPQPGFVTLKIFDILGRETAVLLNEEKTSGDYEIEFNASGLTSGIYFYKLQTGNFSSVKKMILIK